MLGLKNAMPAEAQNRVGDYHHVNDDLSNEKAIPNRIVVLFLVTGTAHAVEIPKQYRGDWCQTKWQTVYKRGLKDCSGAELEIRRTYWNTVESTCNVLSVRKSKYGGHRLLATCEADEGSRDMPPRVEVRWWLGTNNTRLQIITKDVED
jgi:hypothetical protein